MLSHIPVGAMLWVRYCRILKSIATGGLGVEGRGGTRVDLSLVEMTSVSGMAGLSVEARQSRSSD